MSNKSFYFLVTKYVYINPPIPTIKAQRFCDNHPTASLALVRIQLMIDPSIPGNAAPAFAANLPRRDANACSLFLIHSFALVLSSPSPPPVVFEGVVVDPTPPLGNNASTNKTYSHTKCCQN